MKIFTNNCVYVQRNDIAYLNSYDDAIPLSVYFKAFGMNGSIVNNSNRYEFIKFEDENEIEFFKSLDWMINYDDVKDLPEEELLELGENISNEFNSIAHSFNNMSKKEKNENMDMVNKCELLKFKMLSIRDIILFKQGNLPMILPEEIENPNKKKIKE